MFRPPVLAAVRAIVALVLVVLPAASALSQTGSKPLLFEVKSATNTVYLFGTIHVGARALYPLSAQTEDAFARSSVLALEADPTDQSALMAAMAAGVYQPPDSLRNHISPQLYARLEAALPAIGLPIEYARGMKPFLLAMTLAMLEVQRQGYDPALGLDVHFARRAKEQDMRIVQLESMAEQIELFAGLPAEAHEGMLQLALDGIADGTLAEELEALVTAWKTGDAQAIEASVERETASLPAPVAALLHERIYDDRNQKMADKVAAFLGGTQVHFVAIGAGHLTGASSLPVLLQQKGFAVRRL